MLYTPKSGREMREGISGMSGDAMDKVRRYAQETQSRIMGAIEEGKGAVMDKRSILTSAIEAGREALQKGKAGA